MTIARSISLLATFAFAAPMAFGVDVTIQHFAFHPPDLTIVEGQRVVWTNLDDSEHTATSQTRPGTLVPSGHFNSGLLSPSDSFAFRFTAAGVYHYFCIPHGSSMQGVVTVLPRCDADVDDGAATGEPDGGVTIDDLLYFLRIFEAGGLAADLDDGSSTGTPDGGVTIDDLLYFLLRFEGGC